MSRITALLSSALPISAAAAQAQCVPEWQVQPGGVSLNSRINTLASFQGRLVAGGQFTMAGGAPAGYIAAWDGAAWDAMDGGVNAPVNAVLPFKGRLVVGGGFSTAGGSPAAGVAWWDGADWSGTGGPIGLGAVFDFATFGPDLVGFAGGRVARWTGAAWTPIGSDLDFNCSTISEFQGWLFAAGYASPGGEPDARVARWDGATWSPLAPPAALWGMVQTLHVHAGQLYMGGGNMIDGNVQRWNGAAWSPVGTSSAPWGFVPALATVGDDLVAAGVAPPGQSVMKWNGAAWEPVGQGLTGVVYALQFHATSLVAGGFSNIAIANGPTTPYLAQYGCACYPDCNADAVLTVADFGCFQSTFVAGNMYADCNADGTLNVQDFGCFQTKFVAGCP